MSKSMRLVMAVLSRPLIDIWLYRAPIDPRLGRLEFNQDWFGPIQFSNYSALIPTLFPENCSRDEIDIALPLNERWIHISKMAQRFPALSGPNTGPFPGQVF
jgi:hypothetical protein